MSHVFRKKRLLTVDARASYVSRLFRSDDDHPIIWREYIEGDIQNHPKVGGYKMVKQSTKLAPKIFQSKIYYRREGVFSSLTPFWKHS